MRALLSAISGVLALGASTGAHAWSDLDRMTITQALGDVLASEQYCQLAYNEAAIQRFIAEKVPDTDMEFSGELMLMTQGMAFNLQNMSTSSKAAHCAQIERVSRSYGFLE